MAEARRWGTRRRILNVLDRVHVARPAARLYEHGLAIRSGLGSAPSRAPDGLPVPSAHLRARVGPAHADLDFYLRSGARHADLIRSLLRDEGSSVEDIDALLDFGCGCGRVIRYWRSLPRTSVHGCDIDPDMALWCASHLPFADVRVNTLAPPLPYSDSQFDVIYAFSVFTHLPESLQHSWMKEFSRVLAAGGYLLFSTLGEYYLSLGRLSESERDSYWNGDLVVLFEGAPGTSLCSAYHPRSYVVDELATRFIPISFLPAADDARHDIHLFRKPVVSETEL